MPRLLPLFVLAALLLPSPRSVLAAADEPRQRVNFDANWCFHQGDPMDTQGALDYSKIKDAVLASSATFLTKEGALPILEKNVGVGKAVPCTQPEYDDTAWQKLNLPHDWAIAGPFDQSLPGETGKLPWVGAGWYRKHFHTPPLAPGRQTYLDVDGAMAYAAVWCNGKFVGGWPYGYSSFRLDLTPFLKADGDNVLAVRLDNPPASSRWYPGAGIYRHVWLVETGALHVAHWGGAVEVSTAGADSAALTIKTTLDNAATSPADAEVQTAIYQRAADGSAEGQPLSKTAPATVNVPAAARTAIASTATLPQPKLWDLEHPNLYVAVTTISQAGQPMDRYETTFGVRTAKFTAEGFFLNGKRVPIQGVCDHHDLGALGTAIDETALRRQVTLLKEMGCNAIRTSHNPPAPELLDLCDRLGMLVMDESFDCWVKGKNPNDYHLLFPDWHEKDLRALIRRDRNHPSVVLWSIGNEVPDQGTAAGPAIALELTRIAHDEDGGSANSRRTVAACDNANSGFNDFHKGLDVMGFNYKPTKYGPFREATPAQPVLGSETASCVSSRGFFVFPIQTDKSGGLADFQVSDYSLSAPRWAWPPDVEFQGLDESPFAAGEFVWTGFDYIGEPTPYSGDMTNLLNVHDPAEKARMEKELQELGRNKPPSRSSYFGILDLAGFPKERFYLYQARWRPSLPMAHITPHWTWPDRLDQVTPVHVFTSGDEAELFLNGQSLGRKKKGPHEYRLRWDDVKYAPGTLKVVAYKDGKEWATDEVKTAGDAAKVVLQAERRDPTADGKQLVYIHASVTDKDGLLSPRAANLVKFTVAEPGEIVATDNGNAIDLQAFGSHDRHAFDGKCLVIVRAKPGMAASSLTVRAEADGLEAGQLQIGVK